MPMNPSWKKGSTSFSAIKDPTAESSRTCWPTTTPPSRSARWLHRTKANINRNWPRPWRICAVCSGPTASTKLPGMETKSVAKDDPRYGGFGYGKRERPDGSNMQIALDALHDAGVKSDDPAYAAAVTFATRLQNRSESNDQKWAANDGGFIYPAADGGNSPAGEYTGPDGKPMFRSYGSMTYAGLKSMIYAGLTKDDPRVKAAWTWITQNWTFDENPGLKSGQGNSSESGLYYYYHTAARALRAYGEPIITDAQGNKHDWRIELIDKLATLQKPDGSWVGDAKWMENNPTIVTSFAVLALQEAMADLKEHPGEVK